MASIVIMPKQGLQMTEGIITRWMFAEGQVVTEGKPLFEMETDKLTIEIDSPASGTLLKIIGQAGDTVPITETIAIIGEPGEDFKSLMPGKTGVNPDAAPASGIADEAISSPAVQNTNAANPLSGGRIFATPRAKHTAEGKNLDYRTVTGSGPEGLIIERDILNFQKNVQPKVTALARKIADINEINVAEVEGTGIRGKITKSDIEAAINSRKGVLTSQRTEKIIPFTGMRKAIADKMMQSLHGMAQANHRMKVDMSEIVRFREHLKVDGIKVSYTDIMVKVVANALLDFPIVNSTLIPDGIVTKNYVNMGLAVAVDKGLVVPVIQDADLMTLSEISSVSAELISKAKCGGLTPDNYRGGTFTITNLGMFDIDEFTAVINYPESAILAIGKIDRVPVVDGDNIVIRPVMVLSLTYDHRVIDGAPAAQFLQRIKQILQNPYLMV